MCCLEWRNGGNLILVSCLARAYFMNSVCCMISSGKMRVDIPYELVTASIVRHLTRALWFNYMQSCVSKRSNPS